MIKKNPHFRAKIKKKLLFKIIAETMIPIIRPYDSQPDTLTRAHMMQYSYEITLV